MPNNAKFVAYKQGGMIVTAETEVVDASGLISFKNNISSETQITIHGLVKVGTELITNLNADMLDGAHLSTSELMVAGEHTKLPTEGAVFQFVSDVVAPIQSELDTTQAGAGLADNGSYTADASRVHIAAATSLHNADQLLNDAIVDLASNVGALGAAFNYAGTLNGGTEANPFDMSTIPAGGQDTGDYYKVAVSGHFSFGGSTFYANAGDGIVFNDAGGVDKIDNTNSEVQGTALFVDVQGSSDTGFVVDIDAAFKTRMIDAEADIVSIQGELDDTQAGAGLAADGSYAAPEPSNYIGLATSLFSADVALDAALKAEETARIAADDTLQANIDAEETARTDADAAIQSELDDTQAGAGLNADGAYSVPVGSSYLDASTSLRDASIKLDSALKTEETARIAADGVLQGNIDAEATARADADAAIQSELDDTQAGAGLAADGSYTAPAPSNYLGLATSLFSADVALDAALKAEEDARIAADDTLQANIDAEATARTDADAAIQTELDDTQAGAGLADNGSYTADAGRVHIAAATSLHNADQLLNDAIVDLAANVGALGDAFNYVGTVSGGADAPSAYIMNGPAAETDPGDYFKVAVSGWFSDGTNPAFFANAGDGLVWNNVGGVDKIDNTNSEVQGTAQFVSVSGSTDSGFVVDIDTAFKTRMTDAEADIVSIQGELDATQAGAGLADDGSYAAPEPSNYLGLATSLFSADVALDAALKAEETDRTDADAAIQSELDTTQAGAGLADDGSYTAEATANFISGATDLMDADLLLDAALQQEITDREAAVAGVALSFSSPSGSESIVLADESLTVSGVGNIVVGHTTDVDGNVSVQIGTQDVLFAQAFQQSIQLLAGENLLPGDMVYISADSTVKLASNVTAEESRIIGAVINPAILNAQVDLAIAGQIILLGGAVTTSDPANAYVAGAKVYLGQNGQLDMTPPSSGAIVQVGVVTDATQHTVFFNPQTVAFA